jgi:hypothetical protein
MPIKPCMTATLMMLADPEAACEEARQTVRDFFQPATGRVAPQWEGWSLEVRDGRGRCILLLPFAAAPDLHELAPEATQPAASANVVHLEAARVRRELASLKAQMRDILRRTALLVDRNLRSQDPLPSDAGGRRKSPGGRAARGALTAPDGVGGHE